MLKRLEMVGFKSFADKTVFEFPAGITAIVGPNGSGKSNVVDAVRWVLGEQSAKSLRGGEMADVIFNGSTARKSLGMAEVTMVFDNSRQTLSTQAAEVEITRRVYRDGEGEYLINGQLSRLKDIKDLFLGSGAGASAYSIIEQGRVDALLQASTVDRRAIFEEAAGISRFKARKIESLRRLERVEGNLTRLRDILSEVENQLRGVRLQAAKAQRHQEYSARLRELRLSVGLHEYRLLGEQLAVVDADLTRLRVEFEEAAARSADCSEQATRGDAELERLGLAIHGDESAIAELRAQMAAHAATKLHEGGLATSLDGDIADIRRHIVETDDRIQTLTAARSTIEDEWHGVETRCDEQRAQVEELAARLRELVEILSDLHGRIESSKLDERERVRLAARLQNDAVGIRARLDQTESERGRIGTKSAQAAEDLAGVNQELESLSTSDQELQSRLTAARRRLADHETASDQADQQVDRLRHQLAEWNAERSGLASRIELLEHLERSRDGLGDGIREVLELTQRGELPSVVGLVGDLLDAPREVAHLLDIALGLSAQWFVVRSSDDVSQALMSRTGSLAGRVTLMPLRITALDDTPDQPLARRADRLVSCDLDGLPAQLLGTTWIVPDLATAKSLMIEWPGQRFVTLGGQLLEADGTLTVGNYHAEAGILSRKSELHELRQEAARLDERTSDGEARLAALLQHVDSLGSDSLALSQEIDVLVEQASGLREQIARKRQRQSGLHEEVSQRQAELNGLDDEIERLDAAWRDAKNCAETAEHEAHALHAEIEQAERHVRVRELERVHAQQSCTSAQVSLAQVEQRLAALRDRNDQLAGDLLDRHRERDEFQKRLAVALSRFAASTQAQLVASAAFAECCSALESADRRLAELSTQRDALRVEQRRLHQQMQIAQSAWQAGQERIHSCELQASDYRHRCDSLVQRLREDYQIDLVAEAASTEAAPSPEPELTAANAEIDDLRRKLSRLGSVNLDSLEELAELEQREAALRIQTDDLAAAQTSLTEIIERINRDSRQLFVESFAAIRTNFQDLFRKLFGGGQADVMLENEDDVLESGIEVVARPPGKELRSISLMSGGERTLTAVALLLAIFRSRPSPFCLLDEVDAALDESNTRRLSGVLAEFLADSQFIIVTHAKRTMAAADVLYGVTMQESGVSKRVAVRFEDWPDDQRAAA